MTRVLKPGGTMVIATWCQREAGEKDPITPAEQKKLDFLYPPPPSNPPYKCYPRTGVPRS